MESPPYVAVTVRIPAVEKDVETVACRLANAPVVVEYGIPT